MRFNIQKFNNLDDKKRNLILVIIFIIILVLDFNFLLGLQIKAYKKINLKVSKLKKELILLKQDLANMQEFLKKPTPEYKRNITEEELSLLIEEIYKLANQQNIELIQLKPQKEMAKGVLAYILKMDLNADYYSLVNFIKALEENRIIMSIEELDISSNPKDIFHHKVNLTLKTNVKK